MIFGFWIEFAGSPNKFVVVDSSGEMMFCAIETTDVVTKSPPAEDQPFKFAFLNTQGEEVFDVDGHPGVKGIGAVSLFNLHIIFLFISNSIYYKIYSFPHLFYLSLSLFHSRRLVCDCKTRKRGSRKRSPNKQDFVLLAQTASFLSRWSCGWTNNSKNPETWNMENKNI